MSTVLLIIIFIAFIGLGIPDSLFGAAWPAVYAEFGLPISFASFVTVTISCGTVVSSLFSSRLIRRFGTGRIAAFSTALTAAALLGFSCSGSFLPLCLCAVPLGLGAGAIDTALNNYVALHYSAAHMSFLHCFYGIGVSLSPYVLSLVITGPRGWRGGYRTAFGMQLAIALLLFASLPLWKRVSGQEEEKEEAAGKSLSLREVFCVPGVKEMCWLFVASCGIEYTCGNWGSTFLVEYKNMAADQAARMIMFYYVGMALGRFLSGVLAAKLHSWQIIRIGQGILGAAIVLLLLPLPAAAAGAGVFLIGLGNGPLFPNFNYLTPENFGAEVSQSVMGVQMALSYLGIMLVPAVFGVLGQAAGMGIFPVYLLVFWAVMMGFTWKVRHVLTESGKSRASAAEEGDEAALAENESQSALLEAAAGERSAASAEEDAAAAESGELMLSVEAGENVSVEGDVSAPGSAQENGTIALVVSDAEENGQ